MELCNKLLEMNNELLINHITALGIWVTILSIFFTGLAIFIPIFNYSKFRGFEKETNKKIEIKIKKLQNDIKNELQYSQTLIQNCYSAIGEFYIEKLNKQIDQFINRHEENDAAKISSIINNILLSIYMSKDKTFAIQSIKEIKKLLDEIQAPYDKDLLHEVLHNSLVLHKFTYNENWQIFFGEDKEKYQEFQIIFCEIYGVNYNEIFISQ